MKILFTISSLTALSGLWNVASSLAHSLASEGHDVYIVGSFRIPVEDITISNYLGSILLEEDPSLRYAQRRKQFSAAVTNGVASFKPDILVSHTPQADVVTGEIASSLGLRWIPLVHNWPVPDRRDVGNIKWYVWRTYLRLSYKSADSIISVSKGLSKSLSDGLNVKRITVVSNGVDYASELVTQSPSPTFCLIGRLSPEKDPLRFVRLLAMSKLDGSIVGSGPLEEVVRDKIAKSGAHIQMHGWRPRRDVFAGVDVLVMPSLREGLPLILLEAGARGIPVLASDVGGVGDVLGMDPDLKRICLLGSTASDAEWVAALESLTDRDERTRLGVRLQEIVRSSFEAETQQRKLREVILQSGVPRRSRFSFVSAMIKKVLG